MRTDKQVRQAVRKVFTDLKELEDDIRPHNPLLAEDLERVRIESHRPGSTLDAVLYKGDYEDE